MNSDVGAKTLTSTGTIQSGRTRLLSIYYVGHASAGTLTFKDGGGSGTQKLVITTPASSAADQYQVDIPLDGIVFKTDMHLTISNVNLDGKKIAFTTSPGECTDIAGCNFVALSLRNNVGTRLLLLL